MTTTNKGGTDMVTKTVKLSQILDVYEFVKVVTGYEGEVDIISGRYRVNAKSVMGIFALDLTQPLTVEIHGGDCDKLLSELAPFEVE